MVFFLHDRLSSLEANEWAEVNRLRTLDHTNDDMWEMYFAWYSDRPIFDEHKAWCKAARAMREKIRGMREGLKELKHAAKTAKKESAGKNITGCVDTVPRSEGLDCRGDACKQSTEGNTGHVHNPQEIQGEVG